MQEPQALDDLPLVPHGNLPAMLTVPEVAAKLRVDASTVYRAVTAGRLRAVRLGGRGTTVRIPVDALEELLVARADASATSRRPRQPQPKEEAA